MSGYVPMEIVATLSDPVITYGAQADQMCIDGPLAWAAMMEAGDVPPIDDWPLDFDLPLARWQAPFPRLSDVDPRLFIEGADLLGGRVWGWCAGPARYDALLHGRAEVRRRPAVKEMQDWTSDATVQTSAGRYKGQDIAYPTICAREMRWWAVGDPAEVRRLLARCPSVGKLRHHGHGAVSEWRVIEGGDAEAWRRGRLLPDPAGIPHGIRPPYWHRSRQVPCIRVE